MDSQPQYLSLFEFTTQVGNAIRVRPELQNIWITAELSDLAVRGGHCYVDLIQKNDIGQTIAKMRANIWSSTHSWLSRKFFTATGSQLASGIKVMVKGSATHHQLYGISFNITDINPEFTIGGDLERLRREIIARLEKEGVAGENQKLKLVPNPQRIAVISAPNAAGYGDFMDQLHQNPEGFKFYTRLFSSTMQGDRTAPEVIRALDEIEMTIDLWDCVVIIRGGGATADMNGFDNYELARRVCTFGLPVIVGIGHERDRNVLDELACIRCKTPTAVAGFLLDTMRETWSKTSSLITQITREATLRIEGEKRRLAQIEVSIPSAVSQQLDKERVRLNNFSTALPLAAGSITAREKTRLDSMARQIEATAPAVVTRAMERLDSYEKLIAVLSPDNTLKRGYSITRVAGKAVRDASSLAEGTEIETTLHNGTLHSVISRSKDK